MKRKLNYKQFYWIIDDDEIPTIEYTPYNEQYPTPGMHKVWNKPKKKKKYIEKYMKESLT